MLVPEPCCKRYPRGSRPEVSVFLSTAKKEIQKNIKVEETKKIAANLFPVGGLPKRLKQALLGARAQAPAAVASGQLATARSGPDFLERDSSLFPLISGGGRVAGRKMG